MSAHRIAADVSFCREKSLLLNLLYRHVLGGVTTQYHGHQRIRPQNGRRLDRHNVLQLAFPPWSSDKRTDPGHNRTLFAGSLIGFVNKARRGVGLFFGLHRNELYRPKKEC